MKDYLIINERDNVAVALVDMGNIPQGHKFALKDIGKGEFIYKYGTVIGRATEDIKKGEWVHSHNLKSHLDEKTEYSYTPQLKNVKKEKRTFMGYKRESGRAGIRNEIYIIPTVGCVNGICKELERICQKYIDGSIDGIFALTHQFGCSQLGQDHENIKNLLSKIALNPNATNVLFVGLGCENNGICGIKEVLEPFKRKNIEYLNCQDCKNELEEGEKIIKKFAEKAKNLQREPIDFSELCIGVKCGGSDGFSGLTANPLVGKITDRVIQFGGCAVLTEVPEMFGAEQKLMNKCKDEETFLKFKNMIENFKEFYTGMGFPVYENPSPGNKKGGITTLEEKSLGCIEKAGTTPIMDVLDYAELVREEGLSVLDAPGNDLIASTALASSGCQIVLFTTGRGTPFSTFVPTMKIGTNNRISTFKDNWIDFNAYSMDDEGLFNLLLRTVEGEYCCKSEKMREIAFFKKGVTL